MPTLADYVRLAPFSIDELAEASNSVLRQRPRLQTSKRTVRYYITQRVLPPPIGSPKFARYGMEHLVRLVGARCLQDQGKSLEDIIVELDLLVLDMGQAMKIVQSWADREPEKLVLEATPSRVFDAAPAMMPSMSMPFEMPPGEPPSPAQVVRHPLGHGIVLEYPSALGEEQALLQAAEALDRQIRRLT